MESTSVLQKKESNYVKTNEFVFYLVAVFFYTTMTGIVGSYRQAYLVNVLSLESATVSKINMICSIANFALGFFYAMIIDNRRTGKGGKFRPIILAVAVPLAIFTVLMFYTPKGITGTLLIIYLIFIALAHSACTTFGNMINLVSVVMSPNTKERDKIISFKGISSAVGNSAPLVIILVIAAIFKAYDKSHGTQINTEQLQYIATAALCAVVGAVTMFIGIKSVKERIVYSQEKKNPIEGFKDILSNKYAWTIIVSEFLKNFRGIANYMGVFLAAALLGSTSKFLLFGLPTGIGTAVGMLLINFLLKKFNSKQLYIASGLYSVIINTIAFCVGYMYFKNPTPVFQILFIALLFLIGLQFGASNLLPSMFQADVLEDIELKTRKRLDATLPFVIGIGTTISGTIATSVAPLILYGDNSIIGYIQPIDGVNFDQTFKTKVLLLFFYTVFHGVMMLLAGVPFIFYKLTGKTKADVHEKVLEMRESMKK